MPTEVGKVNQSSLYSDITEAGGLGPAIQGQLTALGSPLRVDRPSSDFAKLIPFDWEVLRNKRRSSQIKSAMHVTESE
jgi:hypothetical protein